MSGAMANPINVDLMSNSYSQAQLFQVILEGVRQTMISLMIEVE